MHVSQLIEASSESVWQILIDTQLWPAWGPSVVAVDCPVRFITPAVKGRVRTALGIWLPFEITRYKELEYWHWKVAGVPATGHRLQSLGADLCKLGFEIPYGLLPYKIVCRRALQNIARLSATVP